MLSFATCILAASCMALPALSVRNTANFKDENVMPKFWRWTYCHDQQHVNNCWQLPFAQKNEFCRFLKSGEMEAKAIAADIKSACIWCQPEEVEQICDVLEIAAAATAGPRGTKMQKSQECGRQLASKLEENSRGMPSELLGCHSVAEFFHAAKGTARETFRTKYNKRTGKPFRNSYASCAATDENYLSTLCDAYFPACLKDNPKPGRPTWSSDTPDLGTISCATAQFDPSAQPVEKPQREKGIYAIECADVMKGKIEATLDKSRIMNLCSSSATYANYLVSTKAISEDGPRFWPEPKQKTCYKSIENYIGTVCWSYMKVCNRYLSWKERHNDAYGNRKPSLTINFDGKDYRCLTIKFDEYLD
eukprot:TRINITY_DN109156_c0_g1_i1.p1 TRINITY_DN109156_c0_g1~~TRINITY_DN109156_c0_g1_i1.p1  ORF type:complete len:363 (-),score=57.57 TRINITY_DN109156_c0_g1_i1:190-1278(-)